MNRLITTIALAATLSCFAACATIEEAPIDDDIEENENENENDENENDDENEEIDELPIAPFDNDSLQAPAESHFLRITGTRNFTFDNDISTDAGDAADFVEFEFPNNSNAAQRMSMILDCDVLGDADALVRATIYEDGERTNQSALCGEGEVFLTVDNTKVQTAVVEFSSAGEASYASYSLTVIGFR